MKRTLIGILVLLVVATAFAHGGHKHQYLGTVKQLHENHLAVTTTDGEAITFTLTAETKLTRGSAVAQRSDLATGVRVSVHVANDGRTATSIKISAPKNK